MKKIVEEGPELYPLIDHDKKIDIYIMFYIATTEAIDRITKRLEELFLKLDFCENINIEIKVLQKIDSSIKSQILNSSKEFIELCKKYIHEDIVDRHWKKAKHEQYYLGYNECALPIVLSHNTPNNSLPLIWWTSEKHNFNGLFPRITRHN